MVMKDSPLFKLLPFWLFVFLFKFAAGLHYTLLSVLGERIMPLWVVGLIVGGASFAQLIFDVPAGFLLDRYGYVRILKLSTFVFFLGALVFTLHFSIPVYLLSVLFGFVGWLFYGPGINAYTLAKAPRQEGGRYMGLQHAFASLGMVCATVLLVFLVHDSPTIIGITLAVIFLVALVALANTDKDQISLADAETSHTHHSYYVRRHLVHKVVGAMKKLNPASLILALQSLSGAIFYGMIWFVVPLVVASQYASGILSFGLGIFDLAVVVLGAFLGKLADRYKKKTLILVGLLVFSVAGLTLGFNLSFLFLILGFLATAGDEMSNASLWSWIELLEINHLDDGLINGVIVLFEDIGWTLGPILAGFLYPWLGPSLAITVGALPIFALWIFSLFFLRSKAEPVVDFISGRTHSRKPTRYRHKK